jgi:hypothetical protein
VAERCFNVYIDESGDEGFKTPESPSGGSSEWLVLAGVIVPEEEDLARSHTVDRLRALLNKPPPRPLHFRKLRHGQRRAAMAALAQEPFVFAAVALNKPQITSPYLRQPPHLYNYGARFLIERLSWYAHDLGRRLNLLFENRASTSYAALEGYMRWVQSDPSCTIRANTIARFAPVSPNVKLAQIADFYASATAAALEPDEFGFPEADYLLRVRHQLYREPDRPVLGYGFKVFPDLDHERYPWAASL